MNAVPASNPHSTAPEGAGTGGDPRAPGETMKFTVLARGARCWPHWVWRLCNGAPRLWADNANIDLKLRWFLPVAVELPSSIQEVTLLYTAGSWGPASEVSFAPRNGESVVYYTSVWPWRHGRVARRSPFSGQPQTDDPRRS